MTMMLQARKSDCLSVHELPAGRGQAAASSHFSTKTEQGSADLCTPERDGCSWTGAR